MDRAILLQMLLIVSSCSARDGGGDGNTTKGHWMHTVSVEGAPLPENIDMIAALDKVSDESYRGKVAAWTDNWAKLHLYSPDLNEWTVENVSNSSASCSRQILIGDHIYRYMCEDSSETIWNYEFGATSWDQISVNGSPTTQNGHYVTAIDNGFFIWGGHGESNSDGTATWLNRGFTFINSTWSKINNENAPKPRVYSTTVWSGLGKNAVTDNKVLLWGGKLTDSGEAEPWSDLNVHVYDLESDSWSQVDAANPPKNATFMHSHWTDRGMLIWGGYTDIYETRSTKPIKAGSIFNLENNGWTAMNSENAPDCTSLSSSGFTGSEFAFWATCGDYTNGPSYQGGIYNVEEDKWYSFAKPDIEFPKGVAISTLWTGAYFFIYSISEDKSKLAGAVYSLD